MTEVHVLVKAPSRYFQFAIVAWRTPFLKNSKWCRVFPAVFTPVFFLYVVSSAGGGILRYTLLRELIENRMDMLPSVVGVTDAVGTAVKIVVDLSRRWNEFTSEIVDQPGGGVLAAILYNLGTILLAVSVSGSSLTTRLGFYTLGVFVMGKGTGLLWSISSQVLKDQGRNRIRSHIRESKNDPGIHLVAHKKEPWDIDGKISQVQVLFRFGATAVGPLFVTQMLLPTVSVSSSYLCLAAIISLLCIAIIFLVRRIHEDDFQEAGNNNTGTSSSSAENEVAAATLTRTVKVGWREVIPFWMQRVFGCCGTTTTLEPEFETEPGYFSDAWIDCGLLNGLTEVVRAGYARVLCLRALSMGLSPLELAHALAITGATAVALFWLSDIADRNRRLASFLSFSILGLGHLGLGLASTSSGVFISAFIFGAGEGLSSGLRDLNKRDYRDEHGPLGERSRNFVATKLGLMGANDTIVEQQAKVVRRKVQGLASPWSDWCDVLNSIAVGIIGHYCGMRLASLTYMGVAVFAAYVSAAVIPDSKPTFVRGVSDRPLWTTWRHYSCCGRNHQQENSYYQNGVASYSPLTETNAQDLVL